MIMQSNIPLTESIEKRIAITKWRTIFFHNHVFCSNILNTIWKVRFIFRLSGIYSSYLNKNNDVIIRSGDAFYA
ncbi:hypothetical protein SE21_15400 [Klebsiella quasipneumoniae]|nr:hypothetical protein SE21_15400 [Klebsiella quasipneumoniae]